MTSRPLTPGERGLVRSIFGDAIDCDAVRINRRKFFLFQPRKAIMAPDGHLWVHPKGDLWSDDYSAERLSLQGLFMHEMTHVWQAQQRGRWYLVLMRHPFCRYAYSFRPDWALERYGLEQQAEIVRHIFLMRNDSSLPGVTHLSSLESVLPFRPA